MTQSTSLESQQQEVRSYTELQCHYLLRIKRLQALLNEEVVYAPAQEFTQRLLVRGIYGTYRECVDEGISDEALHIISGGGDACDLSDIQNASKHLGSY